MRIGYEKPTTASHLTEEPKSYVSEVNEYNNVADHHHLVRGKMHRLNAGKIGIKLDTIDQQLK